MYPHRIRLRGPWETTSTGTTPRRVVLPARWAELGVAVGEMSLSRRFGYPGRIDAHERVWLIGEGLSAPATVFLHGVEIGRATPPRFRFDVTRSLRERNLVDIRLTPIGDRPWDDVALEIRASAYLADVVRVGSAIHGRVAGEADSRLDVYALTNNRPASHANVAAGESFTLPIASDESPTRVELVHVSTVWDVVELIERTTESASVEA